MFIVCFSSIVFLFFLFTVRSTVSYIAGNILKETIDHTQCVQMRTGSISIVEAHLCFFLMSVKIFTCSAPICLRYLSRSPAQALSKPSSATWENTKPSARMKSRPITVTEARVHMPGATVSDTAAFLRAWDVGRYLLFWRFCFEPQ